MENLWIRLFDGRPLNNPVTETNLLHAFGKVPADYVPFLRVECDAIAGIFQDVSCSYQNIDGVWRDVWTVIDRPADEIASIKQSIEAATEERRAKRLAIIQEKIDTESDANALSLWQSCRDLTQAWKIETYDPLSPGFPKYPKQDEQGVWFQP